MNAIAIFSFFIFVLLLVMIAAWRAYRQRIKTTTDLFHGGKSLHWVSVGAALFFTNVSASEFIGGSEAAYINNMTTMAWGVSSVFAMVIVAEFIMPIYLRGRIATTPDFLEQRYDAGTKLLVSCIFLVGYLVNLLPIILYSGAIALNGLFHFSAALHLQHTAGIFLLAVFLGIMGSLYSIVGGLKVIALSDIFLGACLLAGALLLTWFGLKEIGAGEWQKGLHQLLTTRTEHLNAIGGRTDAVPFSGIFTGMLLMNLFYWGTEQVIVQQALSARDLAASQKGIALTAAGKLAGPFLFMLPGIMALHLYPQLPDTIEVFPALVSKLTPPVLSGFLGAIVFGAAILSFSKALNSAGTLFTLNLYKPWLLRSGKEAPEELLLRTSKRFETAASLLAMLIAPLILFASSNFYTYLQKANATFSIPIFTVMSVGFVTRKVPPIAAKIGLLFCAACYLLTQFVFDTGLHFLHVLALLFLLTALLMLLIGKIAPMQSPYLPIRSTTANQQLQPWRNRYWIYALLLSAMVALFVLFSKAVLVR